MVLILFGFLFVNLIQVASINRIGVATILATKCLADALVLVDLLSANRFREILGVVRLLFEEVVAIPCRCLGSHHSIELLV